MRRAALLLSATFTILWLMATPLAHAQSPDLVLTAVNPAQRVVLANHQPSWAEPKADGGAVPADFPLTHLTLVLARSPEVQKAFEKFLQDQQDPTSPDYHHWLTPVEVGERFGVSKHDILAITQWLKSQNLHVDSVSESRMLITFSGPASAIGGSFGTEMHYFNVHGEQRISVNSEPQIPAALAPVIKSMHGLYTLISRPMHNMVARPGARKSSSGGQIPDFTSGTSHFISPGDFAVIYDQGAAYNANAGAGVMIGIIGRSRVDNADIEEFQATFQPKFPQRDPVTLIPPNGLDPGPALTAPPAQAGVVPPSSGDQEEATLDVTRSGSVAPGATVAMIISASSATVDGVDIAAQYAVDANPVPAHILSISFSACEQKAGPAAAAFKDTLFSQGAAEGISIFVSSGDSAAAGCDASFQTPPASQILSTNVNCASGYATCVGGTEFADTASPNTYWSSTNAADETSALSYIPEGAWNEPMNGAAFQVAGTGGGVSSFIPTPSWQTGTGVPAARAGRYTPDVAFSASAHDGYLACFESGGPGSNCALSGSAVFSGTSAAAPDMAGITALLVSSLGGTPLGNLNPMLYKLAAAQPTVFHDVTVASSGVANCVVTTPSMCNNSTAAPSSLTGGLSGYLVGTGYDEATGLGSIDIGNLLGKWTTLPLSGATTTTLSVNENPAFLGNSVKFTATVTTSGASAPSGSVNFTDGGSPLGSGTLSGGAATFTTTTLTAGSHVITAIYGGDGNNTGSSSTPLTQQVVGSYPSPSAISLSPSSTIAGGAGFNLAVQGSDFFPASTVLWNGSARTTTYVNGAELLAAISAADIALAGTNSVTVSNPAPGGVSNSATFATLEAFSGSSGFLSMFVNGGNLGNSALFQSGGLIGLGTTSPAVAMDVVGNNAGLRLSGTGTHQVTVTGATSGRLGQDAGGFFFASDTNGKSVRFLTNNGTLNEWMRITSTGNIGIRTTAPATALQVVGDIRVGTAGTNGCLQNFAGTALAGTCSSDLRLKTNIRPFPHILDKLVKLQPVHFDWKAAEHPDYHFGIGRNSGLIAQEVEQVFPEMVDVDAQGYKMVNYSELPYLTLAAVRELKDENDTLRSQLTEKGQELAELKQQVALMHARLAELEKKRNQRTKKSPQRPQGTSAAKR